MAEKDIAEKILMSYADVFADCINTLVYDGEQKLCPENTRPAPTESFYKGSGLHHQFCDISRYLVKEDHVTIQYIIENETRLQERQILRKISYQGSAYRQQLESKSPVFGVICIVIAWTGRTNKIPLSLHDILIRDGMSPEEAGWIDNSKLMIYRMNNLPLQTRSHFISDMGFVADYLNEGNFEKRREQNIIHPEALCQMMEALTGDTRFTEQMEQLLETRKEEKPVMMCEYINMLEAKGEARGEANGVKKGEERLSALLEKLYDLGRDEDAKLAVRDTETRATLYKEFHIPGYFPEP